MPLLDSCLSSSVLERSVQLTLKVVEVKPHVRDHCGSTNDTAGEVRTGTFAGFDATSGNIRGDNAMDHGSPWGDPTYIEARNVEGRSRRVEERSGQTECVEGT
jgi:hypothetical protein